jgi:hypothetical protein
LLKVRNSLIPFTEMNLQVIKQADYWHKVIGNHEK